MSTYEFPNPTTPFRTAASSHAPVVLLGLLLGLAQPQAGGCENSLFLLSCGVLISSTYEIMDNEVRQGEEGMW